MGEDYIKRGLMICTVHQCSSVDQIETNEMGGTCRAYGERRGVYRVLVWKPKGKIPLGRPRRRWEDNIKMDLREVICGTWTGSIWLRIVIGCELL